MEASNYGGGEFHSENILKLINTSMYFFISCKPSDFVYDDDASMVAITVFNVHKISVKFSLTIAKMVV
ncbi:Hypothetical predicted protein [Octopus vulgaris]|uniref:Uncharacterized protein n=1 Tax=Octopus vulgaris TaxID=6645 RepID=A0AA36AYE6_OCTVU|nr:Hypothetical predicted protein [Octopus vulgaris]